MRQYKSTYNILTRADEDEVFESKWMDSNFIQDPPTKDWDYKREMKVEDVDIWEVLAERGNGVGIYAAYTPYAEFYLVTAGWTSQLTNGRQETRKMETYYGPGAQEKVWARAKSLGCDLTTYKTWVDDQDLWKYKDFGNSISSYNN